ncbi:MAG: FtsH protease activity modulator HflK [Gammaproteobacteria bacterium]|nr:FtsH protease activity modulator HflK [Gammaproteobacteria bacterium]
MTWNEPGKNEKKDPWTGKPRGGDTPPDLEALLKKNLEKLASFFKKEAPGTALPPHTPPHWMFHSVWLGALLLWVLSGFFIVNAASVGVILRFGQYHSTVDPGLHWIPRFIDTANIINEQKINSYFYEAQMLTKDENIVSIAIAVQYRIGDAKDYLFKVVNPQESLQQATASALRQVIGHTNLDDVLTSGREKIRQQVNELLSSILRSYQTGLLITDVTVQPAKAPDEVKEAFDDAIKAQEDEQRIINQAQTYAMQVEPIAKGQAQRLLTDAQAYKQQAVLHAQSETAPFLALLPHYQHAPNLVKTRLYYDAMESVLSNSSKIFLDTAPGNQMIYLPLDKLSPPFSVIPATLNAPSSATSAPTVTTGDKQA